MSIGNQTAFFTAHVRPHATPLPLVPTPGLGLPVPPYTPGQGLVSPALAGEE